jgi:mannose-6-phosphate isomerase-like protein (cupin superfamily)
MDGAIDELTQARVHDRSRFSIYRDEGAPSLDESGMMQYVSSPETDVAAGGLVEAGILDGGVVKTLFRHDEDDGFSLVYAWFKPHYHLPRHSHNVDCLYYVVSGQVIMGSQVVGPGDGFYVPADQAYGYRAGPEGVEVLEFRHSTSFDIKVSEKPAVFEQILQTVKAHHGEWLADQVPPIRRRASNAVQS